MWRDREDGEIMIDVAAATRTYLLSKPAITAVFGTRIYAETDYPEVDYTPSDGPALCFKSRGGSMDTEQDVILTPSMQFKCFGIDEETANEGYRALFDALNGDQGSTVRWSRCEVLGQVLRETAERTEWIYVLTFFRLGISNA